MTRTAYYWDAISLEHDTGHHVEHISRAERLRPERITPQVTGLLTPGLGRHDCPIVRPETPESHRLEAGATVVSGRTLSWINRLHSPRYHDWVQDRCALGTGLLDQGDTFVSAHSYEAALAAVEAALTAVDAVVTGTVENAFCAMRPPGHHALPDRAMGFCIFANVAIAARYLQQQHGLRRIAILDWDVHHGNGTQHFYYDDPDVLFISLHQDPLWPGSGKEWERGSGAAEGATVNIPIAPLTPEQDYLDQFERRVVPAVDAFRPEFVLISAGFDAHRADPLAQLMLTEEAYARMTRWARQLAATHCGGKIVSCLEGGYDLDALEASVVAHVSELAS